MIDDKNANTKGVNICATREMSVSQWETNEFFVAQTTVSATRYSHLSLWLWTVHSFVFLIERLTSRTHLCSSSGISLHNLLFRLSDRLWSVTFSGTVRCLRKILCCDVIVSHSWGEKAVHQDEDGVERNSTQNTGQYDVHYLDRLQLSELFAAVFEEVAGEDEGTVWLKSESKVQDPDETSDPKQWTTTQTSYWPDHRVESVFSLLIPHLLETLNPQVVNVLTRNRCDSFTPKPVSYRYELRSSKTSTLRPYSWCQLPGL